MMGFAIIKIVNESFGIWLVAVEETYHSEIALTTTIISIVPFMRGLGSNNGYRVIALHISKVNHNYANTLYHQ